jgi:transcription antitermination factor NusB
MSNTVPEHVDRRSVARELAMQALYQLDVQGDDLLSRLDYFFRQNTDDDLVLELARKWTKGTWTNIKTCDELIVSSATRYPVARLSQVDRAILRISVYQLKFCPDIPANVVINEAVELAKKYSTAAAPSFVNGVLDAIAKKLAQPSEAKS